MPIKYITKEELKKILSDAPEGTEHQTIMDGLVNKGYTLEGYVPRGAEGKRGPMGPQGVPGATGPQGPAGYSGKDGRDGRDGRDGVDGTNGINGKDGADGKDGRDGKNGTDGSPDTGDQIIIKINDSNEQIDASRIKNLPPAQIIYQGGGHSYPETPIKAGTNITVVRTDSGIVINSTATGGGSGFQQPTGGSVNGSNQDFTWATEPNVIIVDNGNTMQKVSSDGTVNWTGTTTTTLTIAPNADVFAIA